MVCFLLHHHLDTEETPLLPDSQDISCFLLSLILFYKASLQDKEKYRTELCVGHRPGVQQAESVGWPDGLQMITITIHAQRSCQSILSLTQKVKMPNTFGTLQMQQEVLDTCHSFPRQHRIRPYSAFPFKLTPVQEVILTKLSRKVCGL